MINDIDEISQIIKKPTFDKNDLYKLIPQREPFLMVDNIVKIDVKNKLVICEKLISVDNDRYLKGHFPNKPVVPGVIMIEMMAQTSCILGKILNLDKIGTFLLAGVNNCKFFEMATLDDKLTIIAESYKSKGKLCISNCKITKNNNIIAECQITAFLKEM